MYYINNYNEFNSGRLCNVASLLYKKGTSVLSTSDLIKPDTFFSNKYFVSYIFKSLEIQNLKGFEIFDRGRKCDINMKDDKR